MKIAVESCARCDLDNIYATLQHLDVMENVKIDLICCDHFQAVRNEEDLESLSCPSKFRANNARVERAPIPFSDDFTDDFVEVVVD